MPTIFSKYPFAREFIGREDPGNPNEGKQLSLPFGEEDWPEFGEWPQLNNTPVSEGTMLLPPGQKYAGRYTPGYSEVVAGVGDVMTTASGVLGYLGGSKEGELEHQLRMMGAQLQGAAPQATFENVSWRSAFDPQFWASVGKSSARALPFFAAMLPAMATGYGIGAAGAAYLGMGAFGTTVLGSLGATALSRPLEALMEAGGVYNEAISLGKSSGDADKAATETFLKNLTLSGMDATELALALAPVKGSGILMGKVISDVALEGFEEMVQQKFSTEALGQEFSWGSPESIAAGISGAAFGGFMGAGGHMFTVIQNRVVNRLPSELLNDFYSVVEEAEKQGKDPMAARLIGLDVIAQKEGGAEIINQVVQEVAAEAGAPVSATDIMQGIINNLPAYTDQQALEVVTQMHERNATPQEMLAQGYPKELVDKVEKLTVQEAAAEAMGQEKRTSDELAREILADAPRAQTVPESSAQAAPETTTQTDQTQTTQEEPKAISAEQLAEAAHFKAVKALGPTWYTQGPNAYMEAIEGRGPVAQALHDNPTYMDFTESSKTARNAFVKEVAEASNEYTPWNKKQLTAARRAISDGDNSLAWEILDRIISDIHSQEVYSALVGRRLTEEEVTSSWSAAFKQKLNDLRTAALIQRQATRGDVPQDVLELAGIKEEDIAKYSPPPGEDTRTTQEAFDDAVSKLKTAIEVEILPYAKELREKHKQELRKRVAMARSAHDKALAEGASHEEAQKAATKALGGRQERSGEFTVGQVLNEKERAALFERIDRSTMPFFMRNRASTALRELLDDNRLPYRSELEAMEEVLGIEVVRVLLKARSRGELAWTVFFDVLNMPRSILASFDLSAPLRQGAMLSVGHPKEWIDSWKFMFKAVTHESNAVEINNMIFGRGKWADDEGHLEWVRMMRNANLYLHDYTSELKTFGAREELFTSNLIHKIWGIGHGVKMSERAYVTFLNTLRFNTFRSVVESWQNSGKKYNTTDLKELARYINRSTGRGELWMGEYDSMGTQRASNAFGGLANLLFFSPRLQTSRILLPFTAVINESPLVRRQAQKDLLKVAGTATLLLGLLAAHPDITVETDPKSTDFGRIRYGNTRVDILAGYQPWIRFISQMVTGKQQRVSGSETKINRLWTALQFGRGKASPAAAALLDLMWGRTYTGEEIWINTMNPDDIMEQMLNDFAPMIVTDLIDAYSQDKEIGVGMALTGFFGTGVLSYDSSIQLVAEVRALNSDARKKMKEYEEALANGDTDKARKLLTDERLIRYSETLSSAAYRLGKMETQLDSILDNPNISQEDKKRMEIEYETAMIQYARDILNMIQGLPTSGELPKEQKVGGPVSNGYKLSEHTDW